MRCLAKAFEYGQSNTDTKEKDKVINTKLPSIDIDEHLVGPSYPVAESNQINQDPSTSPLKMPQLQANI